MKQIVRWGRGVGVILLTAGLAACASGGGGGGGADDPDYGVATPITVENLHSSSEDLTVFLRPEGGVARINLGTVPRGEARSFRFEGDVGQYRLIAERPVGTTESEPLNITHQSYIIWDMSTNRVVINRR